LVEGLATAPSGGYHFNDKDTAMTVRILTGSKEEIAQKVANLPGEVREVIAFVEEPVAESMQPLPPSDEDFFKEMEPYMVEVGDVDYSREAIYSRMPGE
jgi:hypothetical protein